MESNIDKCRIMNVGRENPQNRYNTNKITLNRSECERYLGVQFSLDLRHTKHCVLGFIDRSVKSKSAEVVLKLYLALVRPHFDHAVQLWSSYYRMDIALLESVQKRMTKMIQGIRNIFSYGRSLKLLKFHSLEGSRVRGDLIEVFKWVKGFSKGM